VLPCSRQALAKDEESFATSPESIRMHPDQETLLGMLRDAGLEAFRYHNLCGASSGTSWLPLLMRQRSESAEPQSAAQPARG